MKAPDFWARRGWPGLALIPFGLIYGLITAARMRLPGEALPLPVLCVGNFTLGGSGKTPTVIAVIERLKARGERPFVLTRGHGGTERGPRHVDASRDTAAEVGDEPMLIARHGDVVVARDRAAGARHAALLGATVLVMDDGLQNPGLRKTMALCVVDGATGFGNGLVFPAGPLRAPAWMQWGLTDAALVIGDGAPGDAIAAKAAARGLAVLRGALSPAPAAHALKGMKTLAFCGIGRPEKFRQTLTEIGADVVQFHAFADHHVLSEAEARDLARRAAEANLALVTTEKDYMRLLGDPLARGLLAGAVNTVPVELRFKAPAEIEALMDRLLAKRST